MKNFKLGSLKDLGSMGLRMVNGNLPSILSGFVIFGLVATAIATYKAAPEIKSAIDGRKWDKSEGDPDADVTLSPIETASAVAPYAWKPVVCGAFSVGCIVGAQVLNVQRLTMLAGAYKLSEGKLKEYEEKARELFGEKKATDLHDAVAKDMCDVPFDRSTITKTGRGNEVFFDTFTGRYFYSSMETIRSVESKLNQVLLCGEFVHLSDLYYELGLPEVKLGDWFGWKAYDAYRSSAVHFDVTCEAREVDDEMVVVHILDYTVGIDEDFFNVRTI